MIAAAAIAEETAGVGDVIRHHGDARRWCHALSMAGAPIKTRVVFADVLKVTIEVPDRDTMAASEVTETGGVA